MPGPAPSPASAAGAIGLGLHPAGYPTAAFFAVSALVVNYHVFSEWLSLLVKTRSSQAVKRLLDLQPDTARVLREGSEIEVAVSEIRVGEVVRVRPGERVPVDGVVADGRSAIDQSLVTGEPIPIEVEPAAKVIGGSVNTTGSLLIDVTVVGEASFLSQVVRSVEDARALKPGILHLVDRILRVYTPSVLSISALALIGWILGSWAATGSVDIERAVFAALSVLVMGYPCAVGIAAPLSIGRSAGEAADQGILMRTGEAFQAFRQVTTVVFDKTGTLTEVRPAHRRPPRPPKGPRRPRSYVLALAAAAEAPAEHPLARAIVEAAIERDLPLSSAADFASATGRGITATVGHQHVVVGRTALFAEHGIDAGPLAERIEALEETGRTVVAVGADGGLLGALALGDELRADAPAAVAGLEAAGVIAVLLTGDNPGPPPRWRRTPASKGSTPACSQERRPTSSANCSRSGRVAMVGDGINDAPALMQADVGVAMGGGTDIAMESADVIILNSRLTSVLAAREISRRSYRKTSQNVALAFTINGIGIPIAATGLLHPVWAMAAMAVSVTSVFANSPWGRPQLLIQALLSVGGRHKPNADGAAAVVEAA